MKGKVIEVILLNCVESLINHFFSTNIVYKTICCIVCFVFFVCALKKVFCFKIKFNLKVRGYLFVNKCVLNDSVLNMAKKPKV